ncbi:MAG: TonB-dependent receptor [Henriciella sp.]|nr:TonB-dependent receptor [Henriciella sp.]
MTKRFNLTKLAGASALALTVHSVALAQDGETDSDESARTLETVFVSATKRAESIQDVPVSVATVDAELIAETGAIDLADISVYVPNFEFSDASILPNLYIRGIGSGTTHSIEQSVGRFVDGVYTGRAAINFHPLMDIANVEVLRGPQGTLFGKNTLAGAVIINTGDPTEDFDAGIKASVSEYSTVGGTAGIEAFMSGSLTENISARAVVLYNDRDGYIDNQDSGPDGGTREDIGGRLKLRWDVNPSTTLNLKLERMDYEEEGLTPSETIASNFPLGLFQSYNPDYTFEKDWVSFYDCEAVIEGNGTFCPGRDQTMHNVTFDVEHTVEGLGTFTATTGYQEVDYLHLFSQVDGGVAGGAARFTRDEAYSALTQEVLFTSELYERFDYILGAYYETSEVTRLQRDDTNVPAFAGGGPPPVTFNEDWTQDTETFAAFGQVRYNFSEQLTAVVGGRWSTESKDFTLVGRDVAYGLDPRDPTVPGTTVIDFADDRSESKFTPSFTLRYQPNEDLMVFGSVSQGHKTGGFSDRPQDEQEFDSELNTAYEIGVKSTSADGRLQLNAAVFLMQIEDLQVARTLPGDASVSFEVQNAAEAISQGIEVDGRYVFDNGFEIGGNYAYTDATYDDFPGANTAPCPEVGGRVEGDLCNYDGIPLIFAPEHKGTIWAAYNADEVIGTWGLSVRGDAKYSSEYYTENNYFEELKQDAYWSLGASAALNSGDGKYSVRLYGKNLTDEYILAWGLEAGPSRFVAPNPPREIGLQFIYRH